MGIEPIWQINSHTVPLYLLLVLEPVSLSDSFLLRSNILTFIPSRAEFSFLCLSVQRMCRKREQSQ